MFVRMILVATAVLALPGTALAQQGPTAPPVAEAMSPEQVALEAGAEAFQTRVRAMGAEMQAAVAAAAGDPAKLDADLEAIVSRHQPEVDAFAAALEAYFAAPPADVSEVDRAGMIQSAPRVAARLRGLPTLMKAQALQAGAAPAPTTPQ